jgi:hypothetical protein
MPDTDPDSVYCHMVQAGQVGGTDGEDPPYSARQNQQFAKIVFCVAPSMLPANESE